MGNIMTRAAVSKIMADEGLTAEQRTEQSFNGTFAIITSGRPGHQHVIHPVNTPVLHVELSKDPIHALTGVPFHLVEHLAEMDHRQHQIKIDAHIVFIDIDLAAALGGSPAPDVLRVMRIDHAIRIVDRMIDAPPVGRHVHGPPFF